MLELNKIYQGDCLELMPLISDKSIDMILCDLPYGQTQNKWDSVINLTGLWNCYKKVIKDNGVVVLFGQGMFTAELMFSNKTMWRYNLIWKKGNRGSGFLNSNRMPLRNHEDIMIFYKELPIYNPQFTIGEKNHSKGHGGRKKTTNNNYGEYKFVEDRVTNEKYPLSIVDFKRPHPPIHPTQKPVALFEYLIKTYTNEGELVLDNCIGSGTTAIACMQTNRNFIGIELEPKYVEIANKRIEKFKQQLVMV